MTALKTKSWKQWIRKIKVKGIIVILKKLTFHTASFLRSMKEDQYNLALHFVALQMFTRE
jgi:hypothetical protein